MNNNQTPNVPKTIAEKEKDTLLFWQENKIFEKSVDTPSGDTPKGSFSFYDGPPFATGLPHYGHILAGTIKDAIPRFQTMRGNSVRRVWGWDCHGLPIENLIEKKLGLKSKKDIEDFGIDKFNKDAYDSVLQYEEEWRQVIPRLGRWVDMDHPYKTMDATYTESIWWAWKTLHEKGLAYEGNKMMHICPRCETPLAQSEVGLEYHDVTDLSVTAKFELVDEPGTFVLAWTTTPWTLPGNTALALHKDEVYVKVKTINTHVRSATGEIVYEHYILAKNIFDGLYKRDDKDTLKLAFDLVYSNVQKEGEETIKAEEVETMLGSSLVGKSYKSIFPYFKDAEIENKKNIYKIWHADFITDDSGTGIAHQAPAFGADDMELAKANNIPIIKHVKMDGTFIPAVTDFAGMKVKAAGDTQSADIEIIKYLAHAGLLFEKHKIIHSYPLCWRCKTPLLNYATSSWFVDVPKMKDKLIAENQKIGWTPEHTRDGRFGKWLEGAREWAVSRTRYWGAPLPVWKNEDGEMVMIGSLKELAEMNKQKPKNTYYVMRHGESESNVAGILDCDGDHTNSLTEKGKEEAKASAEMLKDKHIDLIVTSPFLRTKMTAEIVSEVLGGVEIMEDERLKEVNLGVYDKRKISDYIKETGTLKYLAFDTRVEGGETHREVMNRMMQAFMHTELAYEGRNILYITHGGAVRMFIAGVENLTEEELLLDEASKDTRLYPKNAEVIEIHPLILPRDATGAVNLHRPYIDDVELEIEGKTYKRIPDVFDCWFESGSMPFAQLHYPFENNELFDKSYPAEFIAEGVDQTRGWFYSLINLGVGLFDKAPYKHVIVNGLVLAESGVKLSKSEKNYTDPMELVEKYGADAVRYALLSSPVVKGENIQFTDKAIEDIYKKVVMKLENILSLYGMNKPSNLVPVSSSSNILDIWMMSVMHTALLKVTRGYESYVLDDATRPIESLVDDLSVWYVRRSRDRLKGETGDEDQMRAYETLSYVLLTISKMIAPVMPFLAERVYKAVGGEKESVHLETWPEVGAIQSEVMSSMSETRTLVSEALMKRTESKIPVRQPLLTLTIVTELSDMYLDILKEEVNVKNIVRGDSTVLDTVINDELRAEGDVRNLMRAIQDARKEQGLSPKDVVTLVTSYVTPETFKSELMKTCNVSEIIRGEGTNVIELSQGAVTFDIGLSKI